MTVFNKLTEASAGPLSPQTSGWGRWAASHLLRRTTFAPLQSEVDEAISIGIDATVDRLLADLPPLAPPVYVDYDEHPDAGIGDTWFGLYLYRGNPSDNSDHNARNRSIALWTVQAAANCSFNIREKMVLFWNNHFGMGGIRQMQGRVRYFNLYREYATGNFRDLVKKITIEPYMLSFLNGSSNTARNPNENFAREILELFTIGRGPEAGPGDYTTYTENDVTELARAFTGWRGRNINATTPDTEEEAFYDDRRHDKGLKQLSNRFDNAVIDNADDQEYANVVDLILTKVEVARYITRKIYRHFLFYDITPFVEKRVIEPLADILVANDYVLKPMLRTFFTSRHFYNGTFIGAQIRTPFEYALSLIRPTNFLEQGTLYDNYRAAYTVYRHCQVTGMDLHFPPSVAGWTAYYQSPSFHELWLNTATIQERNRFASRSSKGHFGWGGQKRYVEWLPVLDAFPDPANANQVVRDMAKLLLPRLLTQAQIDDLLALLLDGLSVRGWQSEYENYLDNPMDEMISSAIEARLNAMVFGFTELAEFQAQ